MNELLVAKWLGLGWCFTYPLGVAGDQGKVASDWLAGLTGTGLQPIMSWLVVVVGATRQPGRGCHLAVIFHSFHGLASLPVEAEYTED